MSDDPCFKFSSRNFDMYTCNAFLSALCLDHWYGSEEKTLLSSLLLCVICKYGAGNIFSTLL